MESYFPEFLTLVSCIAWSIVAFGCLWSGVYTVIPWIRNRSYLPKVLRPTCNTCHYDLTGLTSKTCPECGHLPPRAASQFKRFKVNRRRGLAGMVIVLIGLEISSVAPRLDAGEGWMAIVPSTLMVCTFDRRDGTDQTHFRSTLRKRRAALWYWQIALGRWHESGSLSEQEKGRMIYSRPFWPEGSSVAFIVTENPEFTPLFHERLIEITSLNAQTTPGFRRIKPLGILQSSCIPDPSEVFVGDPLPVGTHHIPFQIKLHEPDGRIITFAHTCEIVVVPEAIQVLKGVQSVQLEQEIRRSLVAMKYGRQRGVRACEASVDVEMYDVTVLARNFISEDIWTPWAMTQLKVEVCDGDRVVSRARIYSRVNADDGWVDPDLKALALEYNSDPGFFYLPDAVLNRLIVRVTGDQAAAASNLAASSYWGGEVVIPLRDVLSKRNRADGG